MGWVVVVIMCGMCGVSGGYWVGMLGSSSDFSICASSSSVSFGALAAFRGGSRSSCCAMR